MSVYFPTAHGTFIEAVVPRLESSNNVVVCVDVSGSMAGSPIKAVCAVLRDVWAKTNTAYTVLCYNTAMTRTNVEAVAARDLVAVGGTSFRAIFDAMRDVLVSQPVATTFVFMTDGCDTDANPAELQRSMDTFRLVAGGLRKAAAPVTVHAIGFGGGVDADFLNRVRTMGTKDGLFRFATDSGELTSSFNDMFEFAAAAREVTLAVGGRTHTAYGNEGFVCFLVDGELVENGGGGGVAGGDAAAAASAGNASVSALVTAAGAPAFQTTLVRLAPAAVSPLRALRALNLVVPADEGAVREVLRLVHEVSAAGANLLERMEVAQLKADVSDRMMEYLKLLTQIKMGQVPAAVKLRLSAMRHDATFSDMARKRKLDLRVSKNVEYFRRTDIDGILAGFKAGISPEGWDAIRATRGDWVCAVTLDDIHNVMQKSADNVLCVGVLVERQEAAVDAAPGAGLKLCSVSCTLITYDAFVRAMDLAKQGAALAAGYGAFAGVNDAVCIVGAARERINAVIPLFINAEHMKRVRILEGLWLGYLFTLDSYGYDKSQEVGLLHVLRDAIAQRTGTAHNARVLRELEALCRFVVAESQGFRSAYPDAAYAAFLAGSKRHAAASDAAAATTTALIVAYLRGELDRAAPQAYLGEIRAALRPPQPQLERAGAAAAPGGGGGGGGGAAAGAGVPPAAAAAPLATQLSPAAAAALAAPDATLRVLLYGSTETAVTARAASTSAGPSDAADFVDASFATFFDDETRAPVPLVPEAAAAARRPIVDAADALPALRPLLPPASAPLADLCEYAGLGAGFVERALDLQAARAEVVAVLGGVAEPGVALATVDARFQGVASASARFDPTPANVAVVAHAAAQAASLRAFGGLLRYYAPYRRGPVFDAVVATLLAGCAATAAGSSCCPADKLLTLLTNSLDFAGSGSSEPLYADGIAGATCWQPGLAFLAPLETAVGASAWAAAEASHVSARRRVLHLYRPSNIPNRHGHSNHHPFEAYSFTFTGYSRPQ